MAGATEVVYRDQRTSLDDVDPELVRAFPWYFADRINRRAAIPRIGGLGLLAALFLSQTACGTSPGATDHGKTARNSARVTGTLLFASNRQDGQTYQIMSKELAANTPLPLTEGRVSYGNPKVRPVGKPTEAVVWANPGSAPTYIARLDLASGQVQRLTQATDTHYYWDPVVLRDGSLIAKQASDTDDFGDLVYLDTNGDPTPITHLSRTKQELYAPAAYSATHVLATLRNDGDKQSDRIVTVRLQDGNITPIGDPAQQAWYPTYSPGNGLIAYTSNNTIRTMHADGSNSRQVSPETPDTRYFNDPVWYMGYLLCASQAVSNGEGGPFDIVVLTPNGYQTLDASPGSSDDLGPLAIPAA